MVLKDSPEQLSFPDCLCVTYKLQWKILVEVRHYVISSGKDVFDSWLTQLADSRAQAKIATRIDRLAAGNFGDCKPLRKESMNSESIGARATESTTHYLVETAYCFYAVATNGSNLPILNGRSDISGTTKRGV